MEAVDELLDQARAVIDGDVNCHTPEYRALDLLYRAVAILLRRHEGLSETVGTIECDRVRAVGSVRLDN